MKTQSFKEGIDQILLVAKHDAIAIMCADACHGVVIADL
jgi:hypothetical protein